MKRLLLFSLLLLSNVEANALDEPRSRVAETFLKSEKTPLVNYLVPIEITEEASGLQSIDAIYVINLERRPEKWVRMRHLFDQHHLKLNRVNAVDGRLLSLEDQAALSGNYPLKLKPGEIGCLLSHISVFKDAFARGFNRIWICEDDLKIMGDIQTLPILLDKLTQLDPDWDIFYTDMGHAVKRNRIDLRPDQTGKSGDEYGRRQKITREISTSGLRFGMYSLIVSKKGIAKILHYFTHVYLWSPLDWDIHYIEGLKEYSSLREIVTVDRGCPISDTQQP